jgi:predicted DNA-binding protein (MmcQ/YjbR family)
MVKEPRTDDLDPRMDILRDHMLSKPGAVDEFPFGPQAMVFKVAGKMFGLLAWEEVPIYISLKCDPSRAIELREQHPGITGAYYMNKKHWNSVKLDDSVSLELVRELMDHSYDLVVASLSKKVRESLGG